MSGLDRFTNAIHLFAGLFPLGGITYARGGLLRGLLEFGHELGGDQRFFNCIHIAYSGGESKNGQDGSSFGQRTTQFANRWHREIHELMLAENVVANPFGRLKLVSVRDIAETN